MRKLLLLLVLHFLSISRSNAQSYQIPIHQIDSLFTVRYAQADPLKSYYTRLSYTVNDLFLVDNEWLINIIGKLKSSRELETDSAVAVIFDTVMHSFAAKRMWNTWNYMQTKVSSPFIFYSSKFCPCFTNQVNAFPAESNITRLITQCAQQLNTDTTYSKILRSQFSVIALTNEEIKVIDDLLSLYNYQHCPAFFQALNKYLYNEAVYGFRRKIRDEMNRADREAVKLYKEKSAKLATHFPSYKKYESAIIALSSILEKPQTYSILDETPGSGTLTITKTYYSISTKTTLLGQSIYTLDTDSVIPKMRSQEFISADNIRDSKELLTRIEKQNTPPPPLPPGIRLAPVSKSEERRL